MPLETGFRLGPYEILDSLGAGGMGEVYRARDTRLDRVVAIKILSSRLSLDPDHRQRFDREARVISSLTHPHICALYDVGHENGIDFLVMEYLEGSSLAERLARGPLPVEEVLAFGRQIAEALAAAHRSGVVHRDLKPGNVMLTRSGAKLLDFGLARVGVQAPAAESSMTLGAGPTTPNKPLTAEGTILGTFQYMAPEQLEGEEADARTDIFALGALLYEMTTGKPAFEGKSKASLIAAIMSASPSPISQLSPMMPPAFDRVVRTCLRKDPEERWQTAHDVALQLTWIEEGGSEAGIPRPVAARRRSRERTAWMVAAALGLVLAAAGVREIRRPSVPALQTVRFQIPAPAGLTFVDVPKLSPDGRFLAYDAEDSSGVRRVWVHPLDALTAHPLDGTEGASRPCWSADSRALAFFAGDQLKRVQVAGGVVQVLCDGVGGADCAWSQRGVILFDGGRTDSIRSVPAAGGVPKGATRIDRATGQVGHGWPHFLPDGKHFLFQAHYSNGADSLLVGRLGSLQARTLGPAASLMDYSDPGYVLWAQDGALRARRFDLRALAFKGEPFPVITDLAITRPGLANFSTSLNGSLAWRSRGSRRQRLVWVDRSGRELRTVGPPAEYTGPALDPAGGRIVVSVSDSASTNENLWLIDDERGAVSRFTYEPQADADGVWSPDGSQIVFGSTSAGGSGLYLKDSRGVGQPVAIWPDSITRYPSDWSADGRFVLATQYSAESSWDVWILPTDPAGKPRLILSEKFAEAQARFSPDGRWIAYTSNESGRLQVYVQSFQDGGGKWQVSIDGGSEPQWRRDAKELYFLSPERVMMVVEVDASSGFHTTTPRPLFRARVPSNVVVRNRYCASADGQRFLLVSPVTTELPPTTVVLNWTAEVERR